MDLILRSTNYRFFQNYDISYIFIYLTFLVFEWWGGGVLSSLSPWHPYLHGMY